jgi:hypothetical protein
MSDDLSKILTAAIAGLAGTLIPAFVAWRHERDANAARMRKLDEAIKRVAFWDQWLRVSVQLSSPADIERLHKIERELTALGLILETDAELFSKKITVQRNVVAEFHHTIHALPSWRRALLLYAPERTLAWFPRILFYAGFPAFFLIAMVGTDLRADRSTVIGALFMDFILIVWIIVFRSLSRWLEGPSHGIVAALPDLPAHTVAPVTIPL